MNKYIKLEDAINVCREKQIIEGGAATGVRCPTPNEIINDLSDLPTIEVSEDTISREWLLSNIEQGEKEYGGIIDTDTDNVKNFISVAPNVIPKAKEGECPYFIDGVWCNLVGKEIKGAEE